MYIRKFQIIQLSYPLIQNVHRREVVRFHRLKTPSTQIGDMFALTVLRSQLTELTVRGWWPQIIQ